MSKNTKNQKSITSFFKTPGQSTTNESAGSKAKASPMMVEPKKEPIEEEITKLPSASPMMIEPKKEPIEEEITKLPSASPAPGPSLKTTAKAVHSPKKPTVTMPPTVTYQRQPAHQMEWINLSNRFLLANRNFEVQYAHLYAERLGTMRKMVAHAAENRWSKSINFLHTTSSSMFPSP